MGPVWIRNKGTRPIVWKHDHTGKYVIHPGKKELVPAPVAEELCKKYPEKDGAERIAVLAKYPEREKVSKNPAKKSEDEGPAKGK